MKKPILLYGATGYTGRLIARTAKTRGVTLRLAGRNAEKLRVLSQETGFDWTAFPVSDGATISRALDMVAPSLTGKAVQSKPVSCESTRSFSALRPARRRVTPRVFAVRAIRRPVYPVAPYSRMGFFIGLSQKGSRVCRGTDRSHSAHHHPEIDTDPNANRSAGERHARVIKQCPTRLCRASQRSAMRDVS